MEKAILKAQEGGYLLEPSYRDWITEKATSHAGDILLDPEFWRCLGKAEGWGGSPKFRNEQSYKIHEYHMWQAHWHRFIDHLSEGKDINSFFDNLLK
jgi:hypothetical protein